MTSPILNYTSIPIPDNDTAPIQPGTSADMLAHIVRILNNDADVIEWLDIIDTDNHCAGLPLCEIATDTPTINEDTLTPFAADMIVNTYDPEFPSTLTLNYRLLRKGVVDALNHGYRDNSHMLYDAIVNHEWSAARHNLTERDIHTFIHYALLGTRIDINNV